jgi:hypothetical protein
MWHYSSQIAAPCSEAGRDHGYTSACALLQASAYALAYTSLQSRYKTINPWYQLLQTLYQSTSDLAAGTGEQATQSQHQLLHTYMHVSCTHRP